MKTAVKILLMLLVLCSDTEAHPFRNAEIQIPDGWRSVSIGKNSMEHESLKAYLGRPELADIDLFNSIKYPGDFLVLEAMNGRVRVKDLKNYYKSIYALYNSIEKTRMEKPDILYVSSIKSLQVTVDFLKSGNEEIVATRRVETAIPGKDVLYRISFLLKSTDIDNSKMIEDTINSFTLPRTRSRALPIFILIVLISLAILALINAKREKRETS